MPQSVQCAQFSILSPNMVTHSIGIILGIQCYSCYAVLEKKTNTEIGHSGKTQNSAHCPLYVKHGKCLYIAFAKDATGQNTIENRRSKYQRCFKHTAIVILFNKYVVLFIDVPFDSILVFHSVDCSFSLLLLLVHCVYACLIYVNRMWAIEIDGSSSILSMTSYMYWYSENLTRLICTIWTSIPIQHEMFHIHSDSVDCLGSFVLWIATIEIEMNR